MNAILPVVFGYDIAAYSFARIFHEVLGVRSLVVTEGLRGPINDSSILDLRMVPKGTLDDEEAFISTLDAIAADFPSSRLVLLVNTDEAVAFVGKNAEHLSQRWFLPYGSLESITTANSKSEMARVIAELGLCAPARVSIDLSMPEEWQEQLSRLTFPVVVKPERGSDLGHYWNQGLRKVKDVAALPEALELFSSWKDGGVRARLIVQELVMGDDTTQWVVNGYVDSRGKVTACGSGRVILGLHQPEYLGNAGIIMTEHNPELIEQAQAIVSKVGLRGFFSMDAKVDPRDGVARWLDLNPRIGRGHYYLKVAGVDLAAAMIADMEGRDFPFATNTREAIFCIIPASLANATYVRDPQMLARVKRAKRTGIVNPLAYAKDRHPKRTLYRIVNGYNQKKRMKAHYPEATDTGF